MKIYLATIIILVILIYICILKDEDTDDFTNVKAPCRIPTLLDQVMTEYKIKKNNDEWEYFIPCEYDSCEKKIKEFENDSIKRKLFLIDGCDNPASKIELWKILKKHFGKTKASNFMPTTHLLFSENDIQDEVKPLILPSPKLNSISSNSESLSTTVISSSSSSNFHMVLRPGPRPYRPGVGILDAFSDASAVFARLFAEDDPD